MATANSSIPQRGDPIDSAKKHTSLEPISTPPPEPKDPEPHTRRVLFEDRHEDTERSRQIYHDHSHGPRTMVNYRDGYTGYSRYPLRPTVADNNNKVIYRPNPYSPYRPRTPSPPHYPQITHNTSYYSDDDDRRALPHMERDYSTHETRRIIHVDPYDPEDVTIHMSLDTVPDVEGLLEANSRLRRLGHFTAAISQFEDSLAQYLDILYVRVQYGHCLHDARQYNKLSQLAKKYPVTKGINGLPYDDALLNWNLLLRKARAVSELVSGDTVGEKEFTSQAFDGSYHHLDSTKIQNLALAVAIHTEPNFAALDWFWIYEYLRGQQLVWDFRDLFLALEEKLGLKNAHDLIFRSNGLMRTPVEAIIADWSELDEDEVTCFGGLDLFSSLAFVCMKEKGNMSDTEKCLQVAKHLATRLLKLDIQNLKTRPCLMWMMAKVMFEEYKTNKRADSNILFRGTSRGECRTSSKIFPDEGLPLYSPQENEIPEWRPTATELSDKAKETTRVVLQAAEEIGDVSMQVGCLQQLLKQGPSNPMGTIERMNQLWISTGNMAAYLHLQLFRFMLVKTEREKQALRQDILDHGECQTGGFEEYCRYMVLRALTTNEWEKKIYMDRARGMQRHSPDGSDDDGGDYMYWDDGTDKAARRKSFKSPPAREREKRNEDSKKKVEEWQKKQKIRLEVRGRDTEQKLVTSKVSGTGGPVKNVTQRPPPQVRWRASETKDGNTKNRTKEVLVPFAGKRYGVRVADESDEADEWMSSSSSSDVEKVDKSAAERR